MTADSLYGQEWRFRHLLEQAQVGYVLAVPKSQQLKSLFGIWRIDQLTADAPDEAWQILSCGDGAKGPRVYDWAAAKLPVNIVFDPDPPTHERWMLARRSLKRPNEIAYNLAYAPVGALPLSSWSVSPAPAGRSKGLPGRQGPVRPGPVRSAPLPGWYRHITLAMLAHAFLAAMAAAAVKKRGGRNSPTGLAPLTVAEVRRLLAAVRPGRRTAVSAH
ncbi:hypothetical protein GCM10010365_46720 [Streptomyces poonensis]|uniref:Transposase IS701-like DDE domain-containing protein n=1 Tax=Streptomyces poonensis TaxID=68255 RepID=A0A918PS72_9ACTN|nr:hypothetical protein [Streptomyces poonensis]GGZ21014.1 hypothetical protein GCM10010365_46720 [Streptomyces poonensis]